MTTTQELPAQHHITALLVAHRDMIEAQQRDDMDAEVAAVQRMEAARAALAAQVEPQPVAWIQELVRAWNEAYPRMNIYAKPGTLVMFDGRGGYESEQQHARKVLQMRGLYEVEYTEVGGTSTAVKLRGVDGRFNSVLFAEPPVAAPHSEARPGEAATERDAAALTLDQRYWLDRRADIIEALRREGLEIWSDKDRVWLHHIKAPTVAAMSSTPAQGDGSPFWCHEQSHDRPRCATQCAECADDGEMPGDASGARVLDPHKPQHCRLGSPVPGFPTQECNCAPGACRLGRDDASGAKGPEHG